MAFMSKIGNILKQTQTVSNGSIYRAIRCFSSSKLFIGGLSFATDENSLREAFVPYGDVFEARIIVDRETGRSRGFGFISYPSVEEASAAIQALDGRDLHGRLIRVAYAADKRGTSQGPRFSSGGGYESGFSGTDGYGVNNGQIGGQHASTVGGSYSGNDGYTDGNVGHYDMGSGGGNSFNNGAPYNGTTGQEHGHWEGRNSDNGDNFSGEDGTGGYANARVG